MDRTTENGTAPAVKLVGLVGSLRSGSYSRVLLGAATELLPAGVDLVEVSLQDVPFYDGDVEASGDPEPVAQLKRAVGEADGLLIVTPEYNRSVPAVVKNAVDWLSRPHGSSPLSEATVGIVASTPGGHTVEGVRDHLAVSVSANTPDLHQPSLGLANIASKSDGGRLVDEEARRDLAGWLDGFVATVRTRIETAAPSAVAGV